MSKVIKRKDKDRSAVKSFFLKQFPGGESGSSNVKKGKGHAKGQAYAGMLDAKSFKARAQQEAKLIIDNARKDVKRIKKEAFDKGFSEGERAGMDKAEKELAPLILSFKDIAAEFEKIKENFYSEHQEIILELSLKIARKIIHQEVLSNKELILGVLTSAIKLAIDRERLEVRVNPKDLELCLKKRLDIIKDIDGIKQIIFEPDENVGKGGAVVEYAFGEIDAKLEGQFAEVERELKGSHFDMENNVIEELGN